MKIEKLLKEIKGIFVPPKKHYYFGKIIYGTPYFNPMNFNPNILFIRKLKLKSDEVYNKYIETYPHFKGKIHPKFSNMPMGRRNKNWTFKLFNNWWHIQIGWPISVGQVELGWKDKWNSPRFEWCPMSYIFIFNWQFIIKWTAPDGDNDKYYEMILHYLYYQDKDINKTKENWGWINTETKESTWNNKYIL